MSVVVFLGPTLDAGEAESQLAARYLPPVRYGDLFRAVSVFKPSVVGIVDGYFNQVPAVWHKEILWAMSEGVQVFGAASMGALRAAELDRFGMNGVGEIYAAYRDGRFPPFDHAFEDDDEVAVVHGPPELDYRAGSEALVNIRATLAAAAREGIIEAATRDELLDRSKQRFYPQRSLEAVIADAADAGIPADGVQALESWIRENKVDQKRRDALSLLREIAAVEDRPKSTADFGFEHTTLWEDATRELLQLPAIPSRVLDELRLLGRQYFELREAVIADVFLVEPQVESLELEADPHESWFERPFRDREVEFYLQCAPPHWLEERMLARLEESGELELLKRRAADKQDKLGGRAPRAADLSELEMLQLLDWYFSEQLGQEIPEDVAGYAAALGGLEAGAFRDLILKEYWYLHPET